MIDGWTQIESIGSIYAAHTSMTRLEWYKFTNPICVCVYPLDRSRSICEAIKSIRMSNRTNFLRERSKNWANPTSLAVKLAVDHFFPRVSFPQQLFEHIPFDMIYTTRARFQTDAICIKWSDNTFAGGVRPHRPSFLYVQLTPFEASIEPIEHKHTKWEWMRTELKLRRPSHVVWFMCFA